MTLDEACVSDLAEGLSDDDVKSLEEGSDQVTSPEGELLLTRMAIECGTPEEVATIFLSELPDDGTVDKHCVAESLQSADLPTGIDEAMATAMTECWPVELLLTVTPSAPGSKGRRRLRASRRGGVAPARAGTLLRWMPRPTSYPSCRSTN